MAAVSMRRVFCPSDMCRKLCVRERSISSSVKPPSGPMTISISSTGVESIDCIESLLVGQARMRVFIDAVDRSVSSDWDGVISRSRFRFDCLQASTTPRRSRDIAAEVGCATDRAVVRGMR